MSGSSKRVVPITHPRTTQEHKRTLHTFTRGAPRGKPHRDGDTGVMHALQDAHSTTRVSRSRHRNSQTTNRTYAIPTAAETRGASTRQGATTAPLHLLHFQSPRTAHTPRTHRAHTAAAAGRGLHSHTAGAPLKTALSLASSTTQQPGSMHGSGNHLPMESGAWSPPHDGQHPPALSTTRKARHRLKLPVCAYTVLLNWRARLTPPCVAHTYASRHSQHPDERPPSAITKRPTPAPTRTIVAR